VYATACPAGLARQCADHGTPGQTPGATPQKKSLHADERDTERVQQARVAYTEEIAALDPQRLKFTDDSGVSLAMARLYGRAPRGERVIGTIPQNYRANVTIPAAFGSRGVEARTCEALDDAIEQALATITISDARSCLHHCGYAFR